MDRPFYGPLPLVIVHGNCPDGFGAAWIAHNFFTKYEQVEPEIVHALYGKEPPDVTGREVYLFDFSYKRPVLLEMKEKAKSIFVIDHHKSAKEDLDGLDFCCFDMDFSGAQMAWQYFYGFTEQAPRLIDYIGDRDLWKFKLPHSKEINTYIASFERTLPNFDSLNQELESVTGFNIAAVQGATLLRQHMNNCQSVAKEALKVTLSERFGKFADQEVIVANCPYHLVSDVGNLLAEQYHLPVITWMRRADLVFQYSLRSNEKDGFDVSEIAKVMKGGGHKFAAGFESKELLV